VASYPHALHCALFPPHRTGRDPTVGRRFPASGSPGNSCLGHTQETAQLYRSQTLLCLSAQLLSQSREFPGFASSSVAGLLPKRLSLLVDRNVFPVRPLRSTSITPLPHYYEPVRLPSKTTPRLCLPSTCCGFHRIPTGLPGSSTNLSVRAIPNHPGEPDDGSTELAEVCSIPFLHRRH